jgi:HD-GYP domain-containing protein (c-di-GMP phosphodiesterase class II)
MPATRNPSYEAAERGLLGYGVLAFAAVLIGSLAFVDDLFEGHQISNVDIDLAIGLGILAFVGLAALRVLEKSRLRHAASARQSAAALGAVRSIGSSTHAHEVVGRIAEHACRALEVERSMVITCDRDNPAVMTVIAGHGIPLELIGSSWPSHHGMCGQVLASGKQVVVDDYRHLTWPLDDPMALDARAGAAVPIVWDGNVRAVLTVVTTDSSRRFGQREVDMLADVGGLGALALEDAEMRERLERTVNIGAQALAAAVSARDQYTAEHSEAVVELAIDVGRKLDLDGDALGRLEAAARLHDVGKLAVPDAVLLKPGPLDEREWSVMRQHPTWGADLLGRVPGMERVSEIVRAEHERWDGRGYPLGLHDAQIPIEARVVFACDAFHAMTSDRPYRRALARTTAVEELIEGAGSQFDPAVVEALLDVLDATAPVLSVTAPAAREAGVPG